MDNKQEVVSWCFKRLSNGDDTLDVVLESGRTDFVIELSPASPAINGYDTLTHIRLLGDAIRNDDDDEADRLSEELADFLGSRCQHFFRRYGRHGECQNNTLDAHVNFPRVHLQLVLQDGTAQLVELPDAPLPNAHRQPLPQHLMEKMNYVRKFKLSEVEVLHTLVQRRLFQVAAAGVPHICKMGGEDELVHELDRLYMITNLIPPDVRVPRLKGIVGLGEGLPGILMTEVEHECSLADVDLDQQPRYKRYTWFTQVRDTVEILHKNDIVWGDVSSHNILIGKNGDAWVVDFGGGWTEGWVSYHRHDTKEGDLEGLSRLHAFLGLA